MTTIAYDGKLLCADSRGECGYLHQGSLQKIRIIEHDRFVAAAFAGTFPEFQTLLDVALGFFGDAQKPAFDSDSQLILIDKNGDAWDWWTNVHGCMKMGRPAAGGSGAPFAMGAMMAGASAFRAVEVASKLDTGTGGEVQCYDITTKTLTGPFGV